MTFFVAVWSLFLAAGFVALSLVLLIGDLFPVACSYCFFSVLFHVLVLVVTSISLGWLGMIFRSSFVDFRFWVPSCSVGGVQR